MKSIVVATDLSARSDRAVERAVLLARDTGGRLTVVSAIDDDLPDRVAKPLARETKARINDQLTMLIKADKNIKAAVRIIHGRHFQAILDAAGDEKADLIVLGRHRTGKTLELFRGSTGERVIRYGQGPVMVVRDRPLANYRRLLIGVDFSPASVRAVIFAARMSKSARLDLVHAFDLPLSGLIAGVRKGKGRTAKDDAAIATMVAEEYRCFLKSLTKMPQKLSFDYEVGQPGKILRRTVKNKKPDLLILGTHGRGALARAVIGSVAEDFLRDPPCDVLVVK